MKINIKRTPQALLSVKILSIVGFCFLFYLIANLIYLQQVSDNDIKSTLKQRSDRAITDLAGAYKNGLWDTSSYVADMSLPQNTPVYVFSMDGFVVDRESPIDGFLTTGNFKYSSSFQTPQTVTTPANEEWRMFSKPLMKGTAQTGIITIGYYQPEQGAIPAIDTQLQSAANTLLNQIKINTNGVDVSAVDERKIGVKLSFEIVDTFNRVLKSVGGVPSYIDKSYLADIQTEQYKTVQDKTSGEPFKVYIRPIIDNNKNPIGIIAYGNSIQQVNKDFQNQLIFSVGTATIIIVILIILLGFLLQREIAALLKTAGETVQKVFYVSQRAGAFGFDKDTGLIYLGDKKMEIPVKTKQYYICKVLFSKPNKNWENDEIVDNMPEAILENFEPGTSFEDKMSRNARMIYDAIRLLNEKANKIFAGDLVLTQEKTYRINPNIQPQNT